ncbi:hypothetical protein BST81_26310 [Leptolyngbya sp. 'hensonii']|uniref:VMAP-C domain-containing protein n=1 Tax=Leptolyngbya sp. 'hensonii' TaxID=1922337 RepID=UPI00094F9C3E|nr:effector-associated domain EAD1-containing protein [Leptolyngbya sp. 'hensonii']OLP15448.1 hypothetical protein BST81_26310 [Leptolyngbya sp. 'hensonii']
MVKNWELDGNQVKKLRLALSRAFQNRKELEQMVRENLNQRLSEIATGGNVKELTSSLIGWAESEGGDQTKGLILGAIREKSQNEDLQEFIETHIENIIDLDTEIVPSKSLTSLIHILEQIDTFQVLWQVGKAILPRQIQVNCSQEIQDFKQSDLSAWFKCFQLLKLFAEGYPTLEEAPSILVFVRKLLGQAELNEGVKRELECWRAENFPDLNPEQAPAQVLPVSSECGGEILQAYLMILLSPVRLHNSKRRTKDIRVLATLRCLLPKGNVKELPIQLNPNITGQDLATEPGTLSTWKKLPQTVQQVLSKAIDELETQKEQLRCTHHELIIELFSPIDYLGEPIDYWMIQDDFDNLVPLISEHRVVLRSYDRVAKPELKNAFSASWHQIKKLQENPEQENPGPGFIQERFHSLDHIDCSRLRTLTETLRNMMGIRITCPLPKSQSDVQKLLQAMLKSGVPMAWWVHDHQLPPNQIEAGIDQFLELNLLGNPCELLERVRSVRSSACDDGLPDEERWGKYLAILWDDWERMPTLKPLDQGGQRSA